MVIQNVLIVYVFITCWYFEAFESADEVSSTPVDKTAFTRNNVKYDA